jgi:hypothetical protein
MADWTPGPWQYDPMTGRVTAQGGASVARILDEIDRSIADANGRLIAEAPALFEALDELQELGAFLLAERLLPHEIEEHLRRAVERVNVSAARVAGWPP